MKRLSLLRHAKAIEADGQIDDHARCLAGRGLNAAKAVGLRTVAPELVLCSSSRRTIETLEAVQAGWDTQPEIRIEAGLYLATASQILHMVQAVPDRFRSVWVIGHNPGLGQLASHLAQANTPLAASAMERFHTAARAQFRLDALYWRDLGGAPIMLELFDPAD
jgi:phosphohistidine phosphatase